MKNSVEQELLYNIRTSNFLGMSMQQSWADLALWEWFFKKREISQLIELGTGHGGMSFYLFLQCCSRSIKFLTFDISMKSSWNTPFVRQLSFDLCFRELDILNDPGLVEYEIWNAGHPLILFCDNGKKSKEVEMFVPRLSIGDYVVVHDWGTEIHKEDMKGYNLIPILQEECEELKSPTRFWRIG